MNARRFRNGTLGNPDLTSLFDLRILSRRAHEAQKEYIDAGYMKRTNTRNIVFFFDHCSPREIFAEYYRSVHPDTEQKIVLEKRASMIDHPLNDVEIQRHIQRVYGIMFTLLLQKEKEKAKASGKSAQGLAGDLREGVQEMEQPNRVVGKAKASSPKITLTCPAEQGRPPRPMRRPAATLEPLTIGKAEANKIAPSGTASGALANPAHVLDFAALYEGWSMVEATEKGYDCVAEENLLRDVAGGDREAGLAEDGGDWDFCG
ncbi:MAG: hypothetical protein Q9197_002040 [Variospora fuerteventurae]